VIRTAGGASADLEAPLDISPEEPMLQAPLPSSGLGGQADLGEFDLGTPVVAPPPARPRPPALSGGGGGRDKPIDRLFRLMVERGASDLHLSADEVPMLRKDGDMVRIEETAQVGPKEMMELLLPIMPPDNQKQFEEENDTDFAYEIERLARFRANVFRDRKGPGAVFRTIPADIITAEQLNLSQAIQDLAHLHKGLVLVTGPTGSGKSTTLAALIDLVNRVRSGHIITIEDPIEFVHPNKKCLVNQREVGVHTDSFKRALRAALREDPDIILVGELRDLETISIAIETAETGHLVFGTLHTTTAYSTVDRVIDQFPPDRQEQIRVMLSESLKAVISQTLCKKIGGGRVAALEVLIANTAVANLIREGKTFQIPSIMQTGKKLGMVLLSEALLNLVKAGTVEPDEAMSKAVDKTTLKALFTQNQIRLRNDPMQ
jgi:twitching motility protein PilT